MDRARIDQLPGIPGNRSRHPIRTEPDIENSPFFRVDRGRLLQAVFFASGTADEVGESAKS